MRRCSPVHATAEIVTVRNDNDIRIGTVTKVEPYGSPTPQYLTQAHDWDGEHPDPADRYDPITVGVFDDPDMAFGEIERRARKEQAPETFCPGHESLDGAHMGESVYCDGSCVKG